MGQKKKKSSASNTSDGYKLIADNRKARFNYELHERYEAGLVLQGSEVKSLRAGKANLTDAYVDVVKDEAFLKQAHIEPYDKGGYANHEAKRQRKLLLHRREIDKLRGQVETKGKSLVPTKIYLKKGRVKLELALATGKKTIDKRQTIQDRQEKREAERALKRVR